MTHPTHIEVDVKTNYLYDESDPDRQRFVFAYTITIYNKGPQPARLVGRHWIITDAHGNEHEIKGDGVVGEFPFIKPGESFQYTSGTILSTPIGCMHGSYQLISREGKSFEATIPAFSLALPNTLH